MIYITTSLYQLVYTILSFDFVLTIHKKVKTLNHVTTFHLLSDLDNQVGSSLFVTKSQVFVSSVYLEVFY